MADAETRTCPNPQCGVVIYENDDSCGRERCVHYVRGLRDGIAQSFRKSDRAKMTSRAAERAIASAAAIVAFCRLAVQGVDEAIDREEALLAAELIDALAEDQLRASDTAGSNKRTADGSEYAGRALQAIAKVWRHPDSWRVGS